MFKYRGFSATGAYIWGERKPQVANPSFDTERLVRPGRLLPEAREVGDRGPLRRAGPGQTGRPDKITEIRGGINFFYARHALKVQADFGQVKTETSSGDAQEQRAAHPDPVHLLEARCGGTSRGAPSGSRRAS